MSRILKKAAVAVATAAVMALGLPATQANAINLVDCGNRIDFLKVHYGYGTEYWACFANAGSYTQYFRYTTQVDAGNNKVQIWVYDNGNQYYRTLQKWESVWWYCCTVDVQKVKIF
ncbi:hypothetical protein ACIRYZ_37505 [Kitasatospora sp. NPDC101155]|uniref:hypothetical protein n=1 Tax=Kitasatospora sp. NPDC101155 TaxID=3364097 RepID=UPI00382AFDEE